jgi:hypothetical protein
VQDHHAEPRHAAGAHAHDHGRPRVHQPCKKLVHVKKQCLGSTFLPDQFSVDVSYDKQEHDALKLLRLFRFPNLTFCC